MAGRAAPQKYAPLVTFLTALPPATTTETLTLAEVEQVIGAALPPSTWARGWPRGTHDGDRPRAWVAVGW